VLRIFFRDLRSEPLDPYTGSAICRFELYKPQTSQNRRGKTKPSPARALVIRVLEIKNQVSCLQPDYDGFVNEPKAGELMTMGLGNAKKPWMYDLDKGVRHSAGIGRHKTGELDGLKLLLDYHAVDVSSIGATHL